MLLGLSMMSYAQVGGNNTGGIVWQAKEFSKDIATFRAKYFLFNHVLGKSEEVNTFEVTPLAAASSGDLTTLLYRSETKNKEGMILGFFGNYWNEAGVVYQGYAFKNFNREETFEFLERISNSIEENKKFLSKSTDYNNIYFTYQDIDVLVSYSGSTRIIRLFWNGFDSTWDGTAFDRSKRRFERKIK